MIFLVFLSVPAIGFVDIDKPFFVIKFSGEQLIIEKFLSSMSKRYFTPKKGMELFNIIGMVAFAGAIEITRQREFEYNDESMKDVAKRQFSKLNKILVVADLVKFAKSNPGVEMASLDKKILEKVLLDTKDAIPEPTEEELLKSKKNRIILKLKNNNYQSYVVKLNKNNIRIKFIGDLINIPKDLKPIIKKIQEKTKKNNAITVVFAFNYGAKSELVNAFKNILKNKNKTINEELVSDHLYTKNIPDPDILIRTGGEKRLSNFLLWQLSYAELFFSDKNWPDFSFSDLKRIVGKFTSIKRKFGGLNE